jgi:hypothetical protein
LRVELPAENAAHRIRVERSNLYDLSCIARTEEECHYIDRLLEGLINEFEAIKKANYQREEMLAGRSNIVGKITPEEPYGSDASCIVSHVDYQKHWGKGA